MRILRSNAIFIALLLPVLAFFSCTSDQDDSKGTLRLFFKDGPIEDEDVVGVYLTVNEVKLKGPEGWIDYDGLAEPVKINLLDYQDQGYFLGEDELDPGTYSEVRLVLAIPEQNSNPQSNPGCYLKYADGSEQPLFVPSGASSGYKAKGEFTLEAGAIVNVTVDLDLREAVVKAGNSGKYILKPVVRLIVNEDAGAIDGVVSNYPGPEKMVVYAYENDTYTETEAETTDDTNPFSNAITNAEVKNDGSFRLLFTESGTFDLYFVIFDENGDVLDVAGNVQDVVVEGSKITELPVDFSSFTTESEGE